MAITNTIVMEIYQAMAAWTYVLLAILLVVKLIQLAMSFTAGGALSPPQPPAPNPKPSPNLSPPNPSPNPSPPNPSPQPPNPSPPNPTPQPGPGQHPDWYPEITKIDFSNSRAHGIVRVRRP